MSGLAGSQHPLPSVTIIDMWSQGVLVAEPISVVHSRGASNPAAISLDQFLGLPASRPAPDLPQTRLCGPSQPGPKDTPGGIHIPLLRSLRFRPAPTCQAFVTQGPRAGDFTEGPGSPCAGLQGSTKPPDHSSKPGQNDPHNIFRRPAFVVDISLLGDSHKNCHPEAQI